MHQERTYRNIIKKCDLVTFRVVVKETDIFVHAKRSVEDLARESILLYRGYLETYIKEYPEFVKTLVPWRINGPFPNVVDDMVEAGKKACVGPMASVAGAIAQRVGQDLLKYSDEIIVENGGDIFLKLDRPVLVGIFAGKSPLSLRIGIKIDTTNEPLSVCTSSGTVGHSLSFGKADAVCVIAKSCAFADACATAIGNIAKSKSDIYYAVSEGKKIEGVLGVLVIIDDKIALGGDIELVAL